MARSEPKKLERFAVIGAGTIGASWVAYFRSDGPEVKRHPDQSSALPVGTDRSPDRRIWRPYRQEHG
jgi:hypothetical protein